MSTIHAAQLVFFTKHAPFDRMKRKHLLWMLERMQLAYYAKEEVIASPRQGEASRFFVIKQAGYITVNDYEAKLLQDKTGLKLDEIAKSVRALIVTLGADGSLIYADGKQIASRGGQNHKPMRQELMDLYHRYFGKRIAL